MTLTDVIDAYVLLQQSLGKRFESARTLLRQFINLSISKCTIRRYI